MLKYIENYLLQRWRAIKDGVWMTSEKVWSNVRTKKYESHEYHDVCNQIEDKYDYVHLVFEVMTHKLLTGENLSLKIKIQSIGKVAGWVQRWQMKKVEVMSLCV